MPLKERVYWHETVEMPFSKELINIPTRADVAIIGAGIPGLSAAYQLARRGARVVVFDAETPGWGASSRNGGMALTGMKVDAAVVEKKYGRDLARQLFDDSLASIDTVDRIINEEDIHCEFARKGHLLLANKPAHYVALQGEVDWYGRHFNHTLRIVPREDLQTEIGSELYYGGLVDETSAGLNPAQYVAGMARAAEHYSAVICSKSRVMELEKNTTGFIVHTERGKTFTTQVLVTTGGYTSAATPALHKRIIPIGSYIVATQALPTELARELIPQRRMVFDYKHFLNYYRLSADDRMIFGGRAAFFPETQSTIRRSAEILRGEMVRIFPQLRDIEVEYAWGGTLDFPFDLMPHTGTMDGIYFVLGFAGHGVALGTHLGINMANAILDDTVKELPYSSYRFPTAPLGLYNGNPWFLPLIGLWHRWLDIIQ